MSGKELRRVKQEGEPGLVRRGRRKPSDRRIAEPVKAKMLRTDFKRVGAGELAFSRTLAYSSRFSLLT